MLPCITRTPTSIDDPLMLIDTPTTVIARELGLADYGKTWQAMQIFTQKRTSETIDELWMLEHPRIFTLGQNAKSEHLLHPGDIPVLQIDRGGQVTYHGPGQLIVYTLIDIQRKKIDIRRLVSALEQAMLDVLADYQLDAYAKREAPGVYLQQQKIGSIGLRIRKGCAYHGLALNIDMDLEPFGRINPCGHPGLQMTSLNHWVNPPPTLATISQKLLRYLTYRLGYTSYHY